MKRVLGFAGRCLSTLVLGVVLGVLGLLVGLAREWNPIVWAISGLTAGAALGFLFPGIVRFWFDVLAESS